MISYFSYRMKAFVIFAASVLGIALSPARAEFLYNEFLTPSFDGQPNTEFSRWSIFYSPNLGANLPDAAAPNGTYQSASAAGFTPPPGSNPVNPFAFWNAANPTITQMVANAAFIIGPGTVGNIYSFSSPLSFELADQTPFTLGTVVFQFQTEGTPADLSSIRLVYENGSGVQELLPAEYIREYRSGSSGFGGAGNRTALQWDLTGLNVSNYKIVWSSAESSMSFQEALLDTSATYVSVVPESRTWTASGAGTWSNGANWQQGSTSVTNGNLRFQNASAANITLDVDRTVGEIIFNSSANVIVSGTSKLTANTGISTGGAASGTYTIGSRYEIGAFNLMNIQAGEVRLNGVVSGSYGLSKTGAGKLVLAANNTFGSASEGVVLDGGILRIEGSNTYGGLTSILKGTLEVAANAPAGSAGALGSGTSAITVGASSNTFSGITEAAQLVIDGNFAVGRNINIELGSFEKRLGARNTTTAAVFSGTIALLGTDGQTSTVTSLKLFAQNTGDVARFSGNITGGRTASTVSINANGETGTVEFSGANKAYANSTVVAGGTLLIATGTSTTGNGNWSVLSGATLHVNGAVGGSGAMTLSPGATLMGSGTVNKAIVISNGVTIAPGTGAGTLSTLAQTWSGGGAYLWEINSLAGGWDRLSMDGALTIDGSPTNPFEIAITSLDLVNGSGLLAGFNDAQNYWWVIATASGGILGFDPSRFTLDTENFQNTFSGTFALSQVGNDLVLGYTAIPEPSVWALLLVATAVVLWLRRRRATESSTFLTPQTKPGTML
jgi:autotransporter-associated beta strand protein